MARRDMKYGALALVGMWLAMGAAGCVTQGRITPEHIAKLRAAQNVEAVRFEPRPLKLANARQFWLVRAVDAVAVSSAANQDSQDGWKEITFEDPMAAVMTEVLRRLEAEHQISIHTRQKSHEGPGKRFQLTFRTVRWGWGDKWSFDPQVKFGFEGSVALVDTAEGAGEVLWNVWCAPEKELAEPMMSLARLTKEQIETLQRTYAEAIERCVSRLFEGLAVSRN